MKITKRGSPPLGERVWHGVCSVCRSEAEASDDEMTNIQPNLPCDLPVWEICPVCRAGDRDNVHGGMLFKPMIAQNCEG